MTTTGQAVTVLMTAQATTWAMTMVAVAPNPVTTTAALAPTR
jgi:hypothetical protein